MYLHILICRRDVSRIYNMSEHERRLSGLVLGYTYTHEIGISNTKFNFNDTSFWAQIMSTTQDLDLAIDCAENTLSCAQHRPRYPALLSRVTGRKDNLLRSLEVMKLLIVDIDVVIIRMSYCH